MKVKAIAFALAAAYAAGVFADRAEVEWLFPLVSCHEGIAFGNAESGFLVYGEGNVLKVTVGRDDAWDHRGGYDWNDDQSYSNIVEALEAKDMERVKALFRRGEIKPGEPRNPTIVPVGRYEFTLSGGVKLDRGVLDTATGLAEIMLVSDSGRPAGKVLLAMDRKSGVLALKWPEGVAAAAGTFPAWKEKMYSTSKKDPLELDPPVRFTLTDGEGFAQPLKIDPAIGSGRVTRGGESFIVAVRGRDAAEAGKKVGSALASPAASYAGIAKSSAEFWREWWRETPVIDVPDPVIREIHDLGMYKFGSMAGEDGVSAPLQGPWIEDYRLPPWHGDYHFNINVQLCYWPAFRGNHFEALRPLFRMIRGWWPQMRENARKFAGVEDGFMLPHSVDDRCRLIGGYWAGTMDFACTPWVCQMMMRYVRMSGDVEFLKSDAYEFMKGTFNTLRALMSEESGRLAFRVSTSPEYDKLGGWGRNSSFQLASVHRLTEDLIDAAAIVGDAPDPRWLDVRRRLPLASFAGGRIGGEIELWEGLTLPESHRHHSHLAGYVPFDILDMDDEAVKKSTRTSAMKFAKHGMGIWSGWSFGWASMIHTRWGNADAAEMMVRYWERMYTNPGHGSRHDVFFPGLSTMRRGTNAKKYGVAGDAPGEEIMQIDGAMACTAAVQEMMVSDSRGVTYVFRGAPGRWTKCSFANVLADNGFLVSAARNRGKVDFVELKSKRGGRMLLDSPWRPGQRIQVELKPGETRRLTAP